MSDLQCRTKRWSKRFLGIMAELSKLTPDSRLSLKKLLLTQAFPQMLTYANCKSWWDLNSKNFSMFKATSIERLLKTCKSTWKLLSKCDWGLSVAIELELWWKRRRSSRIGRIKNLAWSRIKSSGISSSEWCKSMMMEVRIKSMSKSLSEE